MGLQLSPLAHTIETNHYGAHFSAYQLDTRQVGAFIAPVVNFDHFTMSGPTFSPHPHAGFSAVTYVFEDSQGAIVNHDSLGNHVVVQAGELVWTQAGSGMIHHEFPQVNGQAIHGLQLFVNSSKAFKHIDPQMFYLPKTSVASVETAGNRIRVLSGSFADVASPLAQAEPFDFLDVTLSAPFQYNVRAGWNAMIYVLSGQVSVNADGQQQVVGLREVLGMRADAEGGVLQLVPQGEAQVLVFSGKDAKEPVEIYGPFIMNTPEELQAAMTRYRTGQMGRLSA